MMDDSNKMNIVQQQQQWSSFCCTMLLYILHRCWYKYDEDESRQTNKKWAIDGDGNFFPPFFLLLATVK